MTRCAAMPESDCTVDVLSANGDTVLARAEVVAVRRDTVAALGAPTRLTVAVVLKFGADDLLTEMWTSADLVLDRPVTHVLPQRYGFPLQESFDPMV